MCRLVTDYIDRILRENANRALVSDPPLSAREAKERWNEALEKRTAFFGRSGKADNTRTDGQSYSGRGRGGGGANRGRGGSTSHIRGGAQFKGKGAKFQGHSICYQFNKPTGCSRTLKGSGCDNGNNGEYAHVCNFETAPGSFCLAKHPQAGNH